ncbi:hypothetical protein ACFOSW_01680 [Paenibacillus sp. GCM10012303]
MIAPHLFSPNIATFAGDVFLLKDHLRKFKFFAGVEWEKGASLGESASSQVVDCEWMASGPSALLQGGKGMNGVKAVWSC